MARFTYVMSDIHGQFDALMRMLEQIGLFYYDDDNIVPGTYFCYKVLDI